MTPADKPIFAAALLGMAELYERVPSEAAIELWWRALEAHDITAITSAFASHMRDPEQGRWMPKPADILLHVQGGVLRDLAAIAWAAVERAIRTVGAYQTVVFDDEITMMSLFDMGSWPALCNTKEEKLPFVAKEFQQLWATYKRRPKTQYPRELPGIADSTNELAGYRRQAPVLIGNRQQAIRVWETGCNIAVIASPTRTIWSNAITQRQHEEPESTPAVGSEKSITISKKEAA